VSPVRRLLIGAIVVLAAAVGYVAGRTLFRPAGRVLQPIAFDHMKHVEELEMECNVCHEFYASGKHAGLPLLTTCLECHEEAGPDQPELQKIQDLAAAGKTDVFRKLFRIPDHAYYSHRRHAAIAEIPCETCHGGIARTSAPPTRPLVRISMDFCLGCHLDRGLKTDCTGCHH
jgi:hypothetical protein